jgi:hypothetical protein
VRTLRQLEAAQITVAPVVVIDLAQLGDQRNERSERRGDLHERKAANCQPQGESDREP